MQEVKNKKGKKVCCVDFEKKVIEIVVRGDKTIISINENGEMVVSGFNMEMPWLSYIVGTVSDHTLTLHGEEISLRELCGRNSKVAFSVEK